MKRVVGFVVLLLAAGVVFVLRDEPPGPAQPAAPASESRVASPRAQAPRELASRRALADGAEALREHASEVPGFARLPASDQAWVLAQAGARISDPDDPALPRLVAELASVRLFAVSEREEPLPGPRSLEEGR